MPDIKKDSTNLPQQPNEPRLDEDAVTERLEKEADEMAGEAQEVEKQYDQDHDIFTK